VTAKVRLPASFSVSGYHRFSNSRFAIMGDATWTDWSTVPGVVFIYERPTTAGGPTSLPLGFEDSWRLGLGLNYYHNDHLTFRTGVAFDESPVPNAELRSARLPGNDRTWLSFGASYQFNDRMSADFGYAHLFVDDTRINRTSETSGTLVGEYDSNADIVSLQINYQFD
jgi:long-chain fatty acid transport protein